jgi:hypothetical protein
MTGRSQINQRMRLLGLIFWSSVAVLFGAFVATGLGLPKWVLLLGGGGFALACVLLFLGGQFYLCCPLCHTSLASLLLHGGRYFSIEPRFRFCPYCGGDLDDECLGINLSSRAFSTRTGQNSQGAIPADHLEWSSTSFSTAPSRSRRVPPDGLSRRTLTILFAFGVALYVGLLALLVYAVVVHGPDGRG